MIPHAALIFGTLGFLLGAVLFVVAMYEIDRRACNRTWIQQIFTRPLAGTLVNSVMHLGTPTRLSKRLPMLHNPPPEFFPSVERFRQNWRTIRDEALASLSRARPIRTEQFFQEIADAGWHRFYIKWYADIDPEARTACPLTASLVESSPEVQLAMFSILEPGAMIKPHYGPYAGCLRYHLGLDVPNEPGCAITVDDEPYVWENGQDMLWDDTHRHSVHNATSQRRIILFLDVARPQTNAFGSGLRDWVNATFGAATTRGNDVENEQIVKISEGEQIIKIATTPSAEIGPDLSKLILAA